jgi:hypothetical protein
MTPKIKHRGTRPAGGAFEQATSFRPPSMNSLASRSKRSLWLWSLVSPSGWVFRTFWLAAVLQSATLIASASSMVSQYFPMHSGDIRIYHGHRVPWDTATETFVQTSYNGYSTFALNFADEWNNPVTSYYGKAYLSYSGSALALHGISTAWGSLPFNSPVAIMNDQTLTRDGTANSSTTSMLYGVPVDVSVSTTMTTVGTVATPAGTFHNCKLFLLLITTSAYGVALGTACDSAAWVLAPGYGIIQDGVAAWDNISGQWTTEYLGYDYYELVGGTFVVPPVAPGVITLVSPSGALGASSNVRYTWIGDTNASFYELCITKDGKLFSDQWYAPSNSVVSSATGNFAVDVSGHGTGSYQWWVHGWSSAGSGPWSSAGNFTLGIPGAAALITPLNNATVQVRRPQFSWSQSAPAAEWFRLYVSRNGSACIDQWIQGTTTWTPSIDLAAGSYTWMVQTYSSGGLGPWSTNFSFTIPSSVPGAIALLSPTGNLAAGSTQRYTWKADPAAVWYELYVTRDGALFADKWFTLSNSVVGSATGNFAVDVSGHGGGTYQWYVRGWSPDGFGPWSGPASFTIPNPPRPGAATLLSPTSNASITNHCPQLTWSQSVPSADWFRLYITRNGSAYLDQWIEGVTNWTATAGLPAGTYSWWVDTYNSAGLGPWSQSSTFTVPFAVPTSIALIAPTGTVAANSTQRYTWKSDSAALWYELYVTRNGTAFADKWFTLSNSVATDGTTFAVDVSGHGPGAYQWWVRGWSPDGLGPWVGGLTFNE